MSNASNFQGDTPANTDSLTNKGEMSSCRAVTGGTLSESVQALQGAPVLLDLQTDFPRPAVQSKRIAHTSLSVDADVLKDLSAYCETQGLALPDALLAAFALLLARYSHQADLLLGALPARKPTLHPAILRYSLSDTLGFADLARHTREALGTAEMQTHATLAQLCEAMELEGSSSHSPLIQALFIPGPGGTDALADFDLALRIIDSATLQYELSYSVDLFRPTTIERMGGHLNRLLQAAAEEGPSTIWSLPLLTPAEFQTVVFDWNQSDAPFPQACAHELFEEQVRLRPEAPALVFGDASLSYAELNVRANQLAHYLITQGVGPEKLVGVCVKRSMDMVIALLGILKAGGAYVPLDPTYPADRLAFMVADARPTLLLTQQALSGLVQQDDIPVLCMDQEIPGLTGLPQDNLAGRATPDTLAYVIYTSGSTGRPKGVALAHRGLSNLCMAQGEAFEVTEDSQALQFASISFDAAVSETFVTLAKGACLHLIRQESLRSAHEIMSLIEKSGINIVTLPPSLLSVLPARPLPALKTLVLAGEAWSPELTRTWAPGRRMLNAYGPTEGTVCATWFKVDAAVGHSVPIGKPLQNVKTYILDQHGLPVPAGVPGELFIAGPGLARGYLNRPELTAERFVTNPFCQSYSGRMYRTGDKARYLEDGNIEFLGRVDNQVKLRGYRIELGEIEASLTAHEDVRDAVVIVREDHPGEKKLVAYVITSAQPGVPVLKSHLKSTLPDYMVPQAFVFLNSFPMTPNGKVDRKSLPPVTSRA
ncbi:amino acid adenylation domain-containing protein [Uliginosibacterium sp. H3]|uniref:Amino acid adenylation domain-containing protein n=1 Tax=Uliginosibacterium silvisoli TaxID=3114758 RepID=A0ABU6K8B4_9RHOO|nr:amino acid adenylation domain-containing protein [Uliginosibacterium sp. H3]